MSELAGRVSASRWVGLIMVGLAILISGCPVYEDTYSGTFREVTDKSSRTGDAVAVDLFRFGDNVSAIMRFYRRDPITGDPFGEQKFCVWTDAQQFDDDLQKFRLYINEATRDLPRSQLFGHVIDAQTLEITLYEERTRAPFGGIEQLLMRRVSEQPDANCTRIADILLKVSFPRAPDTGAVQTMPEPSDYRIHNPVLAIAWVGVQPANGRLAPVNRQTAAIPLDDGFGTNFDVEQHALKNQRRIPISAPPEIVRMPSGQTTLALGHFVVVDDSEDDRPENIANRDWHFEWDTQAEKLVATSLRRATRPKCPAPTDHWGPALLFVEGSLEQLSSRMQKEIEGAESCAQDGRCDKHFYIVDICAEGDKVLEVRLSDAFKRLPDIALFVTDEFLDADSVPLPRINPY